MDRKYAACYDQPSGARRQPMILFSEFCSYKTLGGGGISEGLRATLLFFLSVELIFILLFAVRFPSVPDCGTPFAHREGC